MRLAHLALATALLTTAAFADNKEITIEAGGKLTASVPKDAEVKTKGDKTSIRAKDLRIYIWGVPNAKSVEAAIPHVGDIIKSEFVKYEVKATDNLKVLGHDAKHVTGKGEEEDDNDPGTADVVLFTDGKHVYAACTHGEGDEAAKERPEFMKFLKSLKGN